MTPVGAQRRNRRNGNDYGTRIHLALLSGARRPLAFSVKPEPPARLWETGFLALL